jgi:hypothetical protein
MGVGDRWPGKTVWSATGCCAGRMRGRQCRRHEGGRCTGSGAQRRLQQLCRCQLEPQRFANGETKIVQFVLRPSIERKLPCP